MQVPEAFVALENQLQDDLECLTEKFIAPIEDETVIPQAQQVPLYGFIGAFLSFQKSWCSQVSTEMPLISGYTQKMDQMSPSFIDYLSKLPEALSLLHKLETSNKQWLFSMEAAEAHAPAGSTFYRLLLAPLIMFKRIFEEIRKIHDGLSEQAAGREPLFHLLYRFQQMFTGALAVTGVNRDFPNLRGWKRLGSVFSGGDTLCNGKRRFIRHQAAVKANAKKSKSELHVFVFSDMILTGPKSNKVDDGFLLVDAQVVDGGDGALVVRQHRTQKELLALAPLNEADKYLWLAELRHFCEWSEIVKLQAARHQYYANQQATKNIGASLVQKSQKKKQQAQQTKVLNQQRRQHQRPQEARDGLSAKKVCPTCRGHQAIEPWVCVCCNRQTCRGCTHLFRGHLVCFGCKSSGKHVNLQETTPLETSVPRARAAPSPSPRGTSPRNNGARPSPGRRPPPAGANGWPHGRPAQPNSPARGAVSPRGAHPRAQSPRGGGSGGGGGPRVPLSPRSHQRPGVVVKQPPRRLIPVSKAYTPGNSTPPGAGAGAGVRRSPMSQSQPTMPTLPSHGGGPGARRNMAADPRITASSAKLPPLASRPPPSSSPRSPRGPVSPRMLPPSGSPRKRDTIGSLPPISLIAPPSLGEAPEPPSSPSNAPQLPPAPELPPEPALPPVLPPVPDLPPL